MKPDNEKIAEVLADTQRYLRDTLIILARNGATPHALGCVVESMRSLNVALADSNEMYPMPMVGGAMMRNSSIDPAWMERFETIEKTILAAVTDKKGE